MQKIALAATLAAALISGQAANAGIVTVKGAFTATNWFVYQGSPTPPIDPLYMNYSATFEDGIVYNPDASILTIFNTNVPYPVVFSRPFAFGAIMISTDGCRRSPGSFCALVSDFATGIPSFVWQAPPSGGSWAAGTITAGAVPEPATWALLIAGFGMTGYAMRRRAAALAA